MSRRDYTIKIATLKEVNLAVDWAAQEGWNPGLSSLPFQAVAAYARSFFPTDRSRFLRDWINQPQSVALGVMHQGTLVGYGVCRACRVGYKIGPLFADSPKLAELLLLALKSQTQPSDPIYLDVPEINEAGIALAKRHEMNPVFETARMYTKFHPELPFARIFGITSFEIG